MAARIKQTKVCLVSTQELRKRGYSKAEMDTIAYALLAEGIQLSDQDVTGPEDGAAMTNRELDDMLGAIEQAAPGFLTAQNIVTREDLRTGKRKPKDEKVGVKRDK